MSDAKHLGRPDPPVGLALRRTSWAWLLPGPAFVAAVAYVDPGNFATNSVAGVTYGPMLLWVVGVASAVAGLVQYLAAKLGAVTGEGLARVCRARYRRPTRLALWAIAELICVATELAEFVGSALGFQLLFGVGPLAAASVTAVTSVVCLQIRRSARRHAFELVITTMVAVVLGSFLYQAWVVGVSPADVLAGVVPRLAGSDSLLLASGIVGATVMPHALFVHSSLAAAEAPPTQGLPVRLRRHRRETVAAMITAGAVNAAMLLVVSAGLHGRTPPTGSLTDIHDGLDSVVSTGVGTAFAVALLVAGLASASVGSLAGVFVMDGFLRHRIPQPVRQGATLVPSGLVVTLTDDPAKALVASQVVLSIGLAFVLVPLLRATGSRDVMGAHRNSRTTASAGWVCVIAIVALNLALVATSV